VANTDWRSSRLRRWEAAAIPILGQPVLSMLNRTLNWRDEGIDHLDNVVRGGRQPIMAFWHGRIFHATVRFKHRGIVVMISENFDGEWIAGLIHRFGYATARGSTSRGGLRALLQLKRELAAGKPVGFALDGPRGPARVAQPGALWLAKATGNPVIPFHLEADRFWTLRSWDRTQIPKPFSTVSVVVGEPFEVAPDTSDADLEAAGRLLEARLAALEARALALVR